MHAQSENSVDNNSSTAQKEWAKPASIQSLLPLSTDNYVSIITVIKRRAWAWSGIHLQRNTEGKVFLSGLKRTVVLGHEFIDIKMWTERFRKKWSQKHGGPRTGDRLHRNINGEFIFSQVVSIERWSLHNSSFTYKYERKGFKRGGKWSQKSGVPCTGVHLHRNMNGKV